MALTDKQYKAIVAKIEKLSNEQLALLNFEVWSEARIRAGISIEKEVANDNR